MGSNLFSIQELENLNSIAESLESGNFRCNVETLKDSYIGAWNFMENPEFYGRERYLNDVFEASKALNNSDSLNNYLRNDELTKYRIMDVSSEAYASILKSGFLRNTDPVQEQPYRHRARKVSGAIEIAEKYL